MPNCWVLIDQKMGDLQPISFSHLRYFIMFTLSLYFVHKHTHKTLFIWLIVVFLLFKIIRKPKLMIQSREKLTLGYITVFIYRLTFYLLMLTIENSASSIHLEHLP